MTATVREDAAPSPPRTWATVDPLDLLTQLLLVPSPTGSVGAAAARLVEVSRRAGFDSDLDAAGNVVMRWGEAALPGPVRSGSGDAGDGILLLGHLDTVPGDIAVRVEDGRLFGRGSVDAKGPLASAVAAVAGQPRTGRPITIVAACDEEGPSLGARHLLDTRGAPASLIVLEPSGWDTVTTAYRGCLRLRAVVERPLAHHAGPEAGAADVLVRRVATLQTRFDRHGLAGSDDVRAVDSVQVRVNALDTFATAHGESAAAEIEVRVPSGATVDGLLRTVRDLLQPAAVEVLSACEPVALSRGNAVARALARAIGAHGARPRYTSKTGTSDLNVVWPVWRCDAAVYGPGDCRLDHTAQESADIDELRRGADVLAAAIQALR